jgi:predicted RNA-binding Zn-ribbon protein involved in translation (DUF1610 family)
MPIPEGGKRNPPACPACGAAIPWDQVRLTKEFACPTCGSQLRARRVYGRAVVLLSVVIAGALGYGIGARGVLWVVFIVVTFFPIGVALMLLIHKRLQPSVKLLLTED